MKILVTGSAGFIGSALVLRLLERGDVVIGIDSHNCYYDPMLKEARLARHIGHPNYTHLRIDLADRQTIKECFAKYKPQRVVNLAAQAGVRYSIDNPLTYVDSNILGFAHILEGCRHNGVEHLVYASSSSVYGGNTKMPFEESDPVDHPVSFYAATKRANELMAHTYSHLYGLPTTGLRFFTVYGPWGRPDMAYFLFTKAILENKPIDVFNYGDMKRDFTYVDDIVEGVIRVMDRVATPPPGSYDPYRIFNIGNNAPVQLLDFIECIERYLKKSTAKRLLPMQDGDVPATYADVTALSDWIDFKPSISIEQGIEQFVRWYTHHYAISND